MKIQIMINTLNIFNYCQSEIEDSRKCEIQCKHCEEYYAPLEEEAELFNDILKRVSKLSKGKLSPEELLELTNDLVNKIQTYR